MSSSRYQVTDADAGMSKVLSASTSSSSPSLYFAQEAKSSSKSNKPPPAHQRQLLRVLAVAFGFALFSIQRSTKIDSAVDERSSLYGEVQQYAHWMLSAAGGGSGTPPEPNLHYVHESYYLNDGNNDNNGDKHSINEYIQEVQQMERLLQERLGTARVNGSSSMRIQSCRRGREQEENSKENTENLNTNANTTTTGERTLYYVDGLGGCRHMLLTTAQEENEQYQANLSNSSIIIYNPHPSQPRLFCGEFIGPDSTLQLVVEEIRRINPAMIICLQRNEPSRMYEHIPGPQNAMDFPPVRIRNGQGRGNANFVQFGLECDMNCQEEKGRIGLVAQRYIDGTDWKFQFSMEGSKYYPQIEINANAYRQNQFYATTSFRSEVPAAYFSWDEYNLSKPAVDYDQAIKGASFLARNCGSRNNRETLVKQMMDWRGENSTSFRIDALSKCLHNAEPQKGWDLSNKVDIMQKYLFHLSLENSNEEDYITEKLWGALESGSVPVYYGAPNARDHAPHRSIILANDFKDGGELAAYLAKVAMNRTLYESYHDWRKRPLTLDEKFVRKYNHTHTHSICRFCRWSYARRYGLGFHHESQTVQSTKLNRRACLGNHGLFTTPIIERWHDDEGGTLLAWLASGDDYGQCLTKNITNDNRSRRIGKGRLKRPIWEHDGVIDLHIDPVIFVGEDIFSLDLLMRKTEGGAWGTESAGRITFREKAWIQNNESRVTVITKPKVHSILAHAETDSSPARIEIMIPSNSLPLRVRIIVDDVDTFHSGAEQDVTFFAEQMEADFQQPLEFFKVA